MISTSPVASTMTKPACDAFTKPRASADDLYTSAEYLDATGGNWHLDDSAFKAKYVRQIVERNKLAFKDVCEIGCGAGGILHHLHEAWGSDVNLVGYEISPAAHALSRQFVRPGLRFEMSDAFASSASPDLTLIMDVVEHVEDCFGFLRKCRANSRYQIYHIPLEITCATAIRDNLALGYAMGHLHHFSWSTAIAALQFTKHRIVDWLYTPVGLERGKLLRTKCANVVRRILPQRLAARALGGYSLMALTEAA